MTWKNTAYRGSWLTEFLQSYTDAVCQSDFCHEGFPDVCLRASGYETTGGGPPDSVQSTPEATQNQMYLRILFTSGALEGRCLMVTATSESDPVVDFVHLFVKQMCKWRNDIVLAVSLYTTDVSPPSGHVSGTIPTTDGRVVSGDTILSLLEAVLFYLPRLPVKSFPDFLDKMNDSDTLGDGLASQIMHIIQVWMCLYISVPTSSHSLQEYLIYGSWYKSLTLLLTDFTHLPPLVEYFKRLC